MGELDGKSALILGASSEKGIGESIARLFAKEGAKVIVSARRADPLAALARDIGARQSHAIFLLRKKLKRLSPIRLKPMVA